MAAPSCPHRARPEPWGLARATRLPQLPKGRGERGSCRSVRGKPSAAGDQVVPASVGQGDACVCGLAAGLGLAALKAEQSLNSREGKQIGK